MKTGNKITIWSFTILRIVVGWHLLYEGIVKLFNTNWSSAFYLMESKWLLSGFFHWILGNETALRIVDFLNVWGLVIIGFCLFMGIFIRPSALSGALLLLLYYIASPPFVYSSVPSTSHFYIINYNLIESIVLIVIASLPKDYLWSIQKLIMYYHSKRKAERFPPAEHHSPASSYDGGRREIIKNLAVVPFFGAVFFGMARKRGWISFEEEILARETEAISGASLLLGKNYSLKELQGKVPSGKIGDITLSRLMIGGNLISGFAHARDLIYVSTWLKNYFTDEKVIETLWLCEACGINTAIFRCDEDTIRIMEKYWARGGKVQWLAQTYPRGDDMTNIKMAIDHGAVGAFIQGGIADQIVLENRIDDLAKAIDFIRSQGIIAGTAAHSITVPQTCVRHGIRADFFMKTYHHNDYWSATTVDPADPYLPKDGKDHNMAHDNIWCVSDKETSDFFRHNSTPWIAYKILAAGAIKPEDGLRFAFEGGADFACVGMFDFQVIEDANLTFSILNSGLKREREWYA